MKRLRWFIFPCIIVLTMAGTLCAQNNEEPNFGFSNKAQSRQRRTESKRSDTSAGDSLTLPSISQREPRFPKNIAKNSSMRDLSSIFSRRNNCRKLRTSRVVFWSFPKRLLCQKKRSSDCVFSHLRFWEKNLNCQSR